MTDKHEALKAAALATKPLVDGSMKAMSAFHSAASPDVVLALIVERDTLAAKLSEILDQKGEPDDSDMGQVHDGSFYPGAQSQDAQRLEWIQRNLFGHKWNGVIDSGSRTRWDIWTGYRHFTMQMIGDTFRAAIDNAMAQGAKQS
jgi:hypothetical protein